MSDQGYGRGTGKPHPVDVLVGARMRQRRIYLDMNQGQLATLLGLTFQQVQKYESGSNRISAGRLHYIAKLLEVPVEWFFQRDEVPLGREELDLLRLYHQLDVSVAATFLGLAQAAVAGGAR